jgi:hypothetical protein
MDALPGGIEVKLGIRTSEPMHLERAKRASVTTGDAIKAAYQQGVKDGQNSLWSPNKPRYSDPQRDAEWLRGYYAGQDIKHGRVR